MLRLIMHLDAHMANGTTLALIVPTSVAGAINYVKENLPTKKKESQKKTWLYEENVIKRWPGCNKI